MNLNKVTLIGNLVKDPLTRSLPSGQNVTSFAIATNHSWKDIKTKERKSSAEFHNILAWGKLGEIAAKYLKKGDKTYVEGRLTNRSWNGKDGMKHYRTEIVMNNMIMLGKAGAVKEKVSQQAQEQSANEEMSVEEVPVTESN